MIPALFIPPSLHRTTSLTISSALLLLQSFTHNAIASARPPYSSTSPPPRLYVHPIHPTLFPQPSSAQINWSTPIPLISTLQQLPPQSQYELISKSSSPQLRRPPCPRLPTARQPPMQATCRRGDRAPCHRPECGREKLNRRENWISGSRKSFPLLIGGNEGREGAGGGGRGEWNGV